LALTLACVEGDGDFDVSVFQFTLGIPGIPDEQVPRILGCVTLGLLALNHFSSDLIDGAQARSEAIALVLGSTCIALPSINSRINFDNSPIVSQSQRTVPDTKEVFYLAREEVEEEALGELAWNSFALLKNTNASFVMFSRGPKLMVARGSFRIPGLPEGIPVTANYPIDKVLSKSFEVTGSERVLRDAVKGQAPALLYLDSQAAIDRTKLYGDLCFLAKGIQSVLIARAGEAGFVVVGANAPRAFSTKQRKWIASIAKKLGTMDL